MEYLTLKIGTEERGLVYEKDFRVGDIFGAFVRTLVSKMVAPGFLQEGQHYWAIIGPGYGPQPVPGSPVFELVADEAAVGLSEKRWLTLRLGEEPRPDEPMSHFRLELHTLPPGARRYQKDFPLSELDGPLRSVRRTLADMELIGPGEEVKIDLYARSGDAPSFEREIVHTLPEGLSGLDIRVETLPEDDAFPEKPMPECLRCHRSGEEPPGELVVFLSQDCHDRLSDYVLRHGSRAVEMGGILIGEVYRQPRVPRLFVEVEDFLPAEEARADSISLRFTHETWQGLQARKRAAFPEHKRIVGWYHTHPPIPMKVEAVTVSSVQFFSPEDTAVQRQIFPKPWQVALVMDAESDEKVFFVWQGDRLVRSAFHTFEKGA